MLSSLWDPDRDVPEEGSGAPSEFGLHPQAQDAGRNGEEWHYHRWGAVGLFVCDNVTTRWTPDKGLTPDAPPLSKSQWKALEYAMQVPCVVAQGNTSRVIWAALLT